MNKKVLCDVPIYGIDKEKFYQKIDKKRNDRYKELVSYGNDEKFSKRESQREILPFVNWKYNQVIGYIEIEIQNREIVFNLYLSEIKRHRCFSNVKNYINFIQTTGLHFYTDNKTNEEIVEKLYEYLNMIKREFICKKSAYFDETVLDNIIKYIDLRQFIEDVNKM